MLFLRSFINLMIVPSIAIYLSQKANRGTFKPTIELAIQYAVATVLNIPLTRVFTFFARKMIGINIEADSSYYTVLAIAASIVLFTINQILFSIKNRTKNSYYAKLASIVFGVCLFSGALVLGALHWQRTANAGTSQSIEEANYIDNTRYNGESRKSDKEISWVKNNDGTYTFMNNMGTERSLYAWYVIKGEENITKTKYSEDSSFTFDLNGDDSLIIKGFVRNYSEGTDKYEQSSYKTYSWQVLNGN